MTLAELTTPLTAAEVRTEIYTGLADVGVTTTDWKPGATARTIIAVVAIVLAALSSLVALVARSGFLALSAGDWLDVVALYVYDVTRRSETFATGEVTITNGGAGVFLDVAVGDLVVKHGTSGKTYRNTETFSLGALGEVTVAIQADEAGSDSNAIPAAIDGFVTTFVGCTVTNASALVGADRETDVALRARCRTKIGVLSPDGPRDAYEFLALSATRADGTPIGVTRFLSVPDGIGGIDVYVADGDGSVAGTAGDESTDLGIIDRDIQVGAAPLGITPRLHSATPLAIDVTYELWLLDTSGRTDDEWTDLVDEALLEFFAGKAIGGDVISPATGKVYVSAIRAAITAVVQPYLLRADVTIPAADVNVDATEAPVLGTPTGTVHQIAEGTV